MSRLLSKESIGSAVLLLFFLVYSVFSSSTPTNEHLITIEQSQTPSSEYNTSSSSFPELVSTPVSPDEFSGLSVRISSGYGKNGEEQMENFEEKQKQLNIHAQPDEQGMFVLFYCFYSSC